MSCGDETICRTSGTAFGCWNTLYSACYASTERCPGNHRDWCWWVSHTDSEFPECRHAVKSVDGDWITAYNCAKTGSTITIVESTRRRVEPVTAHVPGQASTILTAKINERSTVTVTARASSAIPQSGFGAGAGPETPVGAIVGGVIGGLALIVLAAFVLWYIRFQKRKAAGASIQDQVQPTVSGHDSMAFQPQMRPVASGDRYYPGPPPTEDFPNVVKLPSISPLAVELSVSSPTRDSGTAEKKTGRR
ncbi:hypothetical protein ACJZ2D_012590 [Fusarium nematophilum]